MNITKQEKVNNNKSRPNAKLINFLFMFFCTLLWFKAASGTIELHWARGEERETLYWTTIFRWLFMMGFSTIGLLVANELSDDQKEEYRVPNNFFPANNKNADDAVEVHEEKKQEAPSDDDAANEMEEGEQPPSKNHNGS